MKTQKITLTSDRPALEISRGGETTRWEYDVLTLKLECDRLQDVHRLRSGDTLKPPTHALLADFAAFLIVQGLPDCSIDIAFSVYNLVAVQFNQLAKKIADQVAALNDRPS